MIEKPTVLILGAGASYTPYGFPLGSQLLDAICDNCNDTRHPEVVQLVEAVGLRLEKLREMLFILENAHVQSIDAFLAYRTEFIDVGKFAIAYNLIPCEQAGKLTARNTRGESWYHYLFNAMLTAKLEDFSNSKLNIPRPGVHLDARSVLHRPARRPIARTKGKSGRRSKLVVLARRRAQYATPARGR